MFARFASFAAKISTYFVAIKNDSGIFNMVNRDRYMLTMLKFYDGTTEKL
jgi:hypothetical protein